MAIQACADPSLRRWLRLWAAAGPRRTARSCAARARGQPRVSGHRRRLPAGMVPTVPYRQGQRPPCAAMCLWPTIAHVVHACLVALTHMSYIGHAKHSPHATHAYYAPIHSTRLHKRMPSKSKQHRLPSTLSLCLLWAPAGMLLSLRAALLDVASSLSSWREGSNPCGYDQWPYVECASTNASLTPFVVGLNLQVRGCFALGRQQ